MSSIVHSVCELLLLLLLLLLCVCVSYFSNRVLTLVQVVVFPLPCRPTNMMTFGCPLVGCHTGTPGSSSLQSSLNTDVSITLLLLSPAPMSSKSMAALSVRERERECEGFES